MRNVSSCPKCRKPVTIPSDVDADSRVRCPICGEEYPLADAFPPELIPLGEPSKHIWDVAAEPTFAADMVLEIAAEGENEATRVAHDSPMAVVRSRRRKQKSWWQTPVEIITGGLAGCLVAYYGLALYYGPQFKTLFPSIQLPLPGITWLTTASPDGKHKTDQPATKKSQPADATDTGGQ